MQVGVCAAPSMHSPGHRLRCKLIELRMPDPQEVAALPEPAQSEVLGRTQRLVLITEIISPYRIPVFNALAEIDGIDLHVIFLAETDPTQRHWQVYKDEIRFSHEVLPSWRRRLGRYNLLINGRVGSSLRQARPDVIVCGGYNYVASWQALRWARRHQVPFIAWVESTCADRRNRRSLIEFLKHRFMRGCQAFIVAGKSSGEYVKSFGALQNVFTAPDAVDTQFFAQRANSGRQNATARRSELDLPQRFFVFVGRLVPEKGILDLLKAYGALPSELRREVGLVFVGDGPSRSELERQARLISPGSVKFTGFIHRETLPFYYGLAETFVFPTHTDPWGLVVNEAMACSLPVICSRAAGCAADLVEDGRNGLIVPAGDTQALAAAMHRLMLDRDLRLRMGGYSWQRIQLHSPEACAAGIADAVRQRGVRHE